MDQSFYDPVDKEVIVVVGGSWWVPSTCTAEGGLPSNPIFVYAFTTSSKWVNITSTIGTSLIHLGSWTENGIWCTWDYGDGYAFCAEQTSLSGVNSWREYLWVGGATTWTNLTPSMISQPFSVNCPAYDYIMAYDFLGNKVAMGWGVNDSVQPDLEVHTYHDLQWSAYAISPDHAMSTRAFQSFWNFDPTTRRMIVSEGMVGTAKGFVYTWAWDPIEPNVDEHFIGGPHSQPADLDDMGEQLDLVDHVRRDRQWGDAVQRPEVQLPLVLLRQSLVVHAPAAEAGELRRQDHDVGCSRQRMGPVRWGQRDQRVLLQLFVDVQGRRVDQRHMVLRHADAGAVRGDLVLRSSGRIGSSSSEDKRRSPPSTIPTRFPEAFGAI